MHTTVAVPQKPHAGEHQRTALAVLMVALVALLLGWALKTSVESRSSQFTALGGALSLRYPAAWVVSKGDEDTLLVVSDPHAHSSFDPTLIVHVRTLPEGQRLIDVATSWALGRARVLREFHDLGSEETTLGGKPAVRLNSAQVADPPRGVGMAALPIVVRGADTIVIQGNQYLVFSAASEAVAGELDPRFAAILSSVKLTGK